jgi:hypothetical protein
MKTMPLLTGNVSSVVINYSVYVRVRMQQMGEEGFTTPYGDYALRFTDQEDAQKIATYLSQLTCLSVQDETLVVVDPHMDQDVLQRSTQWVNQHLGQTGYIEGVIALYKTVSRNIPLFVQELPPIPMKEAMNEAKLRQHSTASQSISPP